jgi:hypothetical protein
MAEDLASHGYSVTDLPLFEPEEYGYEIEPAFALDTTRRLLLAFVNQYIRGDSSTMRVVTGMKSVSLEAFERK